MKRLGKYIFVHFILLLSLFVAGWKLLPPFFPNSGFVPCRVAHAGGGIDGFTYTNSYKALDVNRAKGFRYFEIDFSFTSDGQMVCLHDWESSFAKQFGYTLQQPLTYKEFAEHARIINYRPCTLDGLSDWMKANSDAKIVTDVKERNMEGLKLVLNVLPDAKRRVIPQIYTPNEFRPAKDMGFEQIIWTLYRYTGNTESVLAWVETFEGPLAVTMPKKRAGTNLPAMLAQRGIPTYVHTVNDDREALKFMQTNKVTEIYTDFLHPL